MYILYVLVLCTYIKQISPVLVDNISTKLCYKHVYCNDVCIMNDLYTISTYVGVCFMGIVIDYVDCNLDI